MSHWGRRAAVACLWPITRLAARAYVAGPDLAHALTACRHLASDGFSSTVCYWNRDDDPPELVAGAYTATVAALADRCPDSYLSVKAPALGFAPDLVSRVARAAAQSSMRLHFDSLAAEMADATFELIEHARSESNRLGCTLPGRWRRSRADAERAIDLGLYVRVVKGQWPEADAPAKDPRDGFLEVVDGLAGRARHVGVATHDAWLAREALRMLRSAGTRCELEMLMGLPSGPALEVARELPVPVRVYVPYGYAWLPYALSQAARHPAVLWWLLADLLPRRPRLPRGRLA